MKPSREQSYEKSKLCGSRNWPHNKFITSEYSANIPFFGKFNINLFRVVWRTAYVVGVLSLTNPFDTNPISGRTWLDLRYISHGMFVHGLIWIGEKIKIQFESIELETQLDKLDKHSFHLLCG
ncbi:unnamed protein product [Brassica napus]|uniref:(rape) hypothetical protein n=1 Tax=Brassica napus TaxID=3708 RepID=A0A816NM00_BRANA|nr:unnamed protein product [Brassica napus]